MKTNLEHYAKGFSIRMGLAKERAVILHTAYQIGVDAGRRLDACIPCGPGKDPGSLSFTWDKGFTHGTIDYFYQRDEMT